MSITRTKNRRLFGSGEYSGYAFLYFKLIIPTILINSPSLTLYPIEILYQVFTQIINLLNVFGIVTDLSLFIDVPKII